MVVVVLGDAGDVMLVEEQSFRNPCPLNTFSSGVLKSQTPMQSNHVEPVVPAK